MLPWSPLLHGSKACFQLLVVVAWPALPVPVRVLGFSVLMFFYYILLFVFSMCILFICIMHVPA